METKTKKKNSKEDQSAEVKEAIAKVNVLLLYF